MQIWGYVPDFDLPAAFASAWANRTILTGLTQVRYYPDADGGLLPYPGAQPVPDWLRSERLPVVALIANQIAGAWDQDIVARVLSDPARRRDHIRRIVACAVAQQYPAVELDYEFLGPPLRDVFSVFVEELAAALHDENRQLAVAVHAKRSEPGDANGPAAQDWKRIGAAVDRVAVMTYDFNPAHPGPIAPFAWTQEVLTFAVSCIPAPKVMQGIPLYGYAWVEGQAPSYLTYREFMDLAHRQSVTPRRDPVDRYLVLDITKGGARIQAWLPDAETVAGLGSIGRQAGVAGYTLWRLGAEESTALTALSTAPGEQTATTS